MCVLDNTIQTLALLYITVGITHELLQGHIFFGSLILRNSDFSLSSVLSALQI